MQAATTSQAKRLATWRNDPVAFARDVLGIEPWSRQIDILRAVASNNFVAVRSGQKVSKSHSDAVLALWWVVTRPGSRVVLTAPSAHQVRNILWPEVRSLYTSARVPLGGTLYKDPNSGLQLGDKWGVFAVTTDKPERLAGLSGDQLFFIVDEASGFPEPLFASVFGNLSGGGKVLLTGNPTLTSGTFYDAFHKNRDHWTTLHVASTESPNFHGGNVPGLSTPQWVEWAKQEWGDDSPLFDVRVRGDFPKQAENCVISLELVEAARTRWLNGVRPDPLVDMAVGVDVARFGDDETVVRGVRGKVALPQLMKRMLDGAGVAGITTEYIRTHRRNENEKPTVNVDVIGVGSSPADHLKPSKELRLREINVAERATADNFSLLRDQLWFALRDWLKDGGTFEPDGKLEAELVAATYGFDAQGRRKVQPKAEIKKKLRRSPDRADALALAIYQAKTVPRGVGRQSLGMF